MASRFIANSDLERVLRRSAAYGAALKTAAEAGAAQARQLARREAYDSGAYHDSIRADAEMEGGEFKARINAMDFKASWIEAGTSRPGLPGRARRVLTRGAQAAGLRFVGGR